MSRKPDPSMRGDDNPEWTAKDFARARPIQEANPSMLEAVAEYRRRDRTVAKPLTDERGEVRELTAEDMERFRPIREADPGMLEAVAAPSRRGRPPVASPKVRVGLRLAADVVQGVRAGGRGYNARVKRVLREALAEGKLQAGHVFGTSSLATSGSAYLLGHERGRFLLDCAVQASH